MFLLFLFVFTDTLIFRNPRVLVKDSVNEGIYEVEEMTEVASSSLNFTGSKGFFVSFQSLALDFSQSLDVSISGNFGGTQLKARLKDTDASYPTDYYSKSLEDVNEIYFTVTDNLSYYANIGKISAFKRNILGFSLGFKGFEVAYGQLWQKKIRKQIQFKDYCRGPYYVDDSYKIVPGSLELFVNGVKREDEFYFFDYQNGSLYFRTADLLEPGDVVYVEYNTYDNIPKIFTYGGYEGGKFSVSFERIYSSKGLFSSLPEGVLDSIKNAGDSISIKPISGGIESAGGEYILEDSIFIYVGKGKGNYLVYFKFVGQGRGDYSFDNLLGGYRFVGAGNGAFQPYFEVEPPVDQNLLTISYKDVSEIAARISYFDLNTLSSKNDNDNLGLEFTARKNFVGNKYDVSLSGHYRSRNFRVLEKEVLNLWGEVEDNSIAEIDFSGNFKALPFSLRSSFQRVGDKNRFALSFLSNPAPLFFSGYLKRADSLEAQLNLGLNFSRFPRGLFSIYYDRRMRFILSDTIENLTYNLGAETKGLRGKVNIFSSLSFDVNADQGQLKVDLDYIPMYWNELLYSVSGVLNISDEFKLSSGISYRPTFVQLFEERYFKSPSGSFSYDSRSGFFVPSSDGDYERQLVSLGALDTTLESSFFADLEFERAEFLGQLGFEKNSSPYSEIQHLQGRLKGKWFNLEGRSLTTKDEKLVNGRTRQEEALNLGIPIYLDFAILFKYLDHLEDPLRYQIKTFGVSRERKQYYVELGLDFTEFNTLLVSGIHLDFRYIRILNTNRVIFSLSGSCPFKNGDSLPFFVPTSKRLIANLTFSRKFGSGEGFINGYLMEGSFRTQKLRVGYTFLF